MYENGALGQATGDALRPGGLDISGQLIGLCALPAGAQVLDVGCGTGATVQQLLEAHSARAVGIDRSELLLQTGHVRSPGLPLACAWGKSLPIASERMDAVFAECSLTAMDSPERVLDEFRRVLVPGGRLALSDLYIRNPLGLPFLRSLPTCCGLRGAMSREELLGLLQAHGFEISAWQDQSEALQELGAQLAAAHGSLGAFWSRSEPGVDLMDLQIAISRAKLGYYLLAAQKI